MPLLEEREGLEMRSRVAAAKASYPIAALLVVAAVVLVAACGRDSAWMTDPVAERAISPDAPEVPEGGPRVVLETNAGEIVIALLPGRAPVSVENFLAYVDSGFYDGTVFHRVITDSPVMVQGGGFDLDRAEKATRGEILNEATNGLSNVRGTVAMARKPPPHTATAQFFVNFEDNTYLDHRDESPRGFGYAVFGVVVGGMDVVDRIARVPTGEVTDAVGNVHPGWPLEDVVIERARRER